MEANQKYNFENQIEKLIKENKKLRLNVTLLTLLLLIDLLAHIIDRFLK